jgi:hypothetical protein
VTEDAKLLPGFAWERLMVEAGVSPVLRQLHRVVWYLMLLLVIATVALTVAAFFNIDLLVPSFAAMLGTVVLILAASWHRRYLVRTVRWQEGTVTFRSVVPGDVGEDGQYVVCDVTIRPPSDITRVATQVGPLDAERLALGGTMRCLIDRNAGFRVLRVFPYATRDAPLPSGRMLKFHKA